MKQRSLSTANGYGTFHTLSRPHLTSRHQGAFDSFKHEHLPRTKYDIIVDETSNKPGEQAFEVGLSARVTCPSLTSDARN